MSIAVNSNGMTIVSERNENNNKKNMDKVKSQVGDVVQGTVSKAADRISIQFSERTAEVSRDVLPNAKEGDILNFRVMGVSGDGTMNLQYIPDSQAGTYSVPASCTAVMKQTLDLKENQEAKEEDLKSVEEDQEDLKRLQNNMTQEDYDDLSKEGFSLERYELERFERALERIKVQRAEIEKSGTQKIDRLKKTKEEFKKAGLSHINDPMLKKQIQTMLDNMNLPANGQNITAVLGAVKLACQAANLSDSSMSYLLSNKMDVTPVNVYMANFNAKPVLKEVIESRQADWEELKTQAEPLINEMNQSGIPASMEDAEWLFEQNLDINAENVTAYQNLKELQINFSVTDTISAIIEGMSKGIEPIHTVLSNQNTGMVQRAVRGFEAVTDAAVNRVIERNQTLNLQNLNMAQKELEQEENAKNSSEKEFRQNADWTEDANGKLEKELSLITARRQLEEIRVKLTYDAGMHLAGKGISLQTEGIENIVTELRNLENKYYQKLLAETGADATKSAIMQVQDTLNYSYMLGQSPEYVLGVRFEERSSMTLAALVDQGEQLSHQCRQVNESYEQLMTAPRSDLGDSINKAFANMDSLLEEMGIAPTKDNKRAVRILSYNHMEINETSMEQMKEYDRQVTGLIKALKPSVVAELVKNQVNPLDTPVDELTRYIKDVMKENGASDEEKYSNYLVKLQKSGELSEEQRESYVGIYRLLRQVEKSDGKAIGYLVNSGREITLNHLLSAVRSSKAQGMDAKIDSSFGTLSGAESTGKSISDQMESAFRQAPPLEAAKSSYNSQLASELYENLTPEFLSYVQNSNDLMELTLEQMEDLYQQYISQNPQTAPEEYQNILNQIQDVMNMTDEMEFLRHQEKKQSIQNIKSAHTLLKDSNHFFEEVTGYMGDEAAKEAKSILDTSQSMEEFVNNYEKVVKSMSLHLRESMDYPTLTIEEMLALNGYQADTSLMQELGSSQYYQIPLEVNGKTIGVGLSIQASDDEKGRLFIHLKSEAFGAIQAELSLNDQELKGLVVCENKAAAAQLRRTIENAGEKFPKEIGKVQIHVCEEQVQGASAVAHRGQKNDLSTTEVLYQTAKVIITGIKELDV